MPFFDSITPYYTAFRELIMTEIAKIKAQAPGALLDFSANELYWNLIGRICSNMAAGAIKLEPTPIPYVDCLQAQRYTKITLGGEMTLGEQGFQPWAHQYLTVQSIVANLIYGGARSAVLADSVGAGKTAQALGVFFALKKLELRKKLVLLIPPATEVDWLETLARFTKTPLIITRTLKELQAVDPQKFEILIIYQTMKRTQGFQDTSIHPFFNPLEVMLIVDEAPKLPTLFKTIVSSVQAITLYLSGTIVTSTVFDISDYMGNMQKWQKSLSTVLGYPLPSKTKNIGPAFLALLNIATLAINTIYLRRHEHLALNIPAAEQVNFIIHGEDAPMAAQSFSPSRLLSYDGVKMKFLREQRRGFTESKHVSLHFLKQIKGIIASAIPNSATLIICASETDLSELSAVLREAFSAYKIIRVKDRDPNTHPYPGESVIYLTTVAKVEGFNVQNSTDNGLLNIIFLGPVDNAGVFVQGVGRAVRPWLKQFTADTKVQTHVLLDQKYSECVKSMLHHSIKGAELLSCLMISPVQAFKTLCDIAMQEAEMAGKACVYSIEQVSRDIVTQLRELLVALKKEIRLSVDDFRRKLIDGTSALVENPLLFANINLFKDGVNDAAWDAIVFHVHAPLKEKFILSCQTAGNTFSFIVNPHVVRLAFSFNAFPVLLAEFRKQVVMPGNITTENVNDCRDVLTLLATQQQVHQAEQQHIQGIIDRLFPQKKAAMPMPAAAVSAEGSQSAKRKSAPTPSEPNPPKTSRMQPPADGSHGSTEFPAAASHGAFFAKSSAAVTPQPAAADMPFVVEFWGPVAVAGPPFDEDLDEILKGICGSSGNYLDGGCADYEP